MGKYLYLMGEIIIQKVKTKGDKKVFIYLPLKIHRKDPNWLPPIYSDEWELFDEKKPILYFILLTAIASL
jgi:hypothetical protein